MTPARAGSLALRALLLLFMAWLYGGDVARWVQARSVEVAAVTELPRLELGLAGLAVAIGGLAVLFLFVTQKKPAGWRPMRLVSIAIVCLLFLDFVVLSSRRSMLSVDEQATLAIHALAEGATELSGSEAVLRDPNALHAMLNELGPVPYFVNGERVPGWKVEVRERCDGPASDPGTAAAGTFVYCVSSDRKHAWVTLVGAAAKTTFGPRAIVGTTEEWVGDVTTTAPPPPEEPVDPASVWEETTQDEAP